MTPLLAIFLVGLVGSGYGQHHSLYDPHYQARYPEVYQNAYFGNLQGYYTGGGHHGYYQDLYNQPAIHDNIYSAQPAEDIQPATPSYSPVLRVAPSPPVVPIETQYQALDEYGQYSFGFSGGDLARSETRDAYGNVQGFYEYLDSDGNVQTQHYVADELGFRVVGSNLPTGPEHLSSSSSPASVPQAPLPVAVPTLHPVTDTPEVAAAKAAFVKAYNAAAIAAANAPDTWEEE